MRGNVILVAFRGDSEKTTGTILIHKWTSLRLGMFRDVMGWKTLKKETYMQLRDQYVTKCGGFLVVPPRTKEHLLVHPEVTQLLEVAARRVILPIDGSFLARAVDLGRPVGYSGCVESEAVGETKQATFAIRTARRKASRVVVGVKGSIVNTVVILAFQAREVTNTYVLVTSYVGDLAPKEPWDTLPGPEREASFAFWSEHALVYDGAVMGEPFQSTWGEIIAG